MNARSARYVGTLLAYRDRMPTIGRVVRRSLRFYALAAAGFAALAVAGSNSGRAIFGSGTAYPTMLVTAYVTMVLRDLGHARRSIALWPVTREVVDWAKVEALARAQDGRGPDPTPSSS